jgi:hypothetical protein
MRAGANHRFISGLDDALLRRPPAGKHPDAVVIDGLDISNRPPHARPAVAGVRRSTAQKVGDMPLPTGIMRVPQSTKGLLPAHDARSRAVLALVIK